MSENNSGNTPIHMSYLYWYLYITLSNPPIMLLSIITATAQSIRQSKLPSQRSLDRALLKSNGDDFFWSYTEEPHRTRRQAIIKAHPEVICSQSGEAALSCILMSLQGNQAMRPRTIDQVLRTCNSYPAIDMCGQLAKHTNTLLPVLSHGLHRWCDG